MNGKYLMKEKLKKNKKKRNTCTTNNKIIEFKNRNGKRKRMQISTICLHVDIKQERSNKRITLKIVLATMRKKKTQLIKYFMLFES